MGRAILHVRKYGDAGLQEEILEACLHCWALDPQIEGTRASYVSDLLSCLPDPAPYRNAVVASLGTGGDSIDTVQRFRLAWIWAEGGDDQALGAMYAAYSPGPGYGAEVGICFVGLRGLKGLLYVAEKLGTLLEANPGCVDSGWLVSDAKERFGDDVVLRALRDEATGNRYIKTFLEHELVRLAAESKEPEPRPDVSSWNYEQLLELAPLSHRYRYRVWGKTANADELRKAAAALKELTDQAIIRAYLGIFSTATFPLDPGLILKLLQHYDDEVRWSAALALCNVTDPRVRAFAFRAVATHDDCQRFAVALLNRNYVEGDHEIIRQWFLKESDRDIKQSMGRAIEEFWERHPNPQFETAILLDRYLHQPCSHCREGVVLRMIELGVLSDDLREECRWDCNEDIRTSVAVHQA